MLRSWVLPSGQLESVRLFWTLVQTSIMLRRQVCSFMSFHSRSAASLRVCWVLIESSSLTRCIHRGSALNWAAATGSCAVLQLLLARGANVENRDLDGKLPVHDAAMTGHLEALRILCEGGCPADASDEHGRSAVFEAAETGSLECLRTRFVSSCLVCSQILHIL